MRITGEKTIIRDTEPADMFDFMVWSADNEIKSLDPEVGMSSDTTLYSIDTLDNVHIGECSLYNRTPVDVQFGIRIGNKSYWNRGYGTDVVCRLTEYAFTVMKVKRVWLKVLPGNTRAIRCYEKCGFKEAGSLRLDRYDFIVMEVRRS